MITAKEQYQQPVFRRPRFALVGAVLLLACATLYKFLAALIDDTIALDTARASESPDDIWSMLPASDKLEWQPCYETFQCTRLNVPLNYSEPNGESVAIAIVQYPSPFPHNSSDYLGPILFNPGGPGGSGVDFTRLTGQSFLDLFESHYDIVGFDPRGIARSERVTAFESDVERELWCRGLGLSELSSRADGIGGALAASTIVGRLALARNTGIFEHINTENTARDMLRITEAYGYGKLQYWGFSYGTVLGGTFASILPDKVGRIIIDGVVDLENYYATLWSNNLRDSEKTLQAFFDSCFEAGPDQCAFYAPSPEAISANVTALYKQLRVSPIPVVDGRAYQIFDYDFVRNSIFRALYSPYVAYPGLATVLSELSQGYGPTLDLIAHSPKVECSCPSPPFEAYAVVDGLTTVACNDGAYVESNVTSLQEFYDEISAEFEFGSLWSSIRMSCSGWPKLPKTHFQGPFEGNTSHPLLLIGNTADPVTPLWAAKKMAKGFKDSVVLQQDSLGHCSLAAVSTCTLTHARDYFINGTLPTRGTICPISDVLFPLEVAPGSQRGNQESWSAEDKLQEIGRSLRAFSAGQRNGPLTFGGF